MAREPTAAELCQFTTLQDIADWAKLKGDVTWAASTPGSLIRLLVNAEDMEDLDISEFASISQKQIEWLFPNWKYSKAQPPPREEVQHWSLSADEVYCEEVPAPNDLARARVFHNAARINAGIIYSRNETNRLRRESQAAPAQPATPPVVRL